jgi:signal transduction histidine kinase/HAMP domain-containing protein
VKNTLGEKLRFTRSLKLQIGLALLALVGLFSFFSLHTLKILDEQRTQGALLRLAGELQTTAQQMAIQAMNYRKNAPTNSAAYRRDLQFYYQDLMHNTSRFDDICKAFSSGDFQRQLEIHEPMNPVLGKATLAAAYELEEYWKEFLANLEQVLGEKKMPQLAAAATLIIKNNTTLVEKTRNLLKALDEDIHHRTRETNIVIRASLSVALIIAAGIMLWFYLRVLRPLGRTLQGFREVSTGNFAYRLPTETDNEIGLLAHAFNRFNARLDTLFRLTSRLQEGSDLAETLEFVSRTFPGLLPLDWVGALFVSDDGMIQLERAFGDGRPEPLGILRFPLSNTLLQQCLESDRPLHIPDVQEVASINSSYRFLRLLAERERRDAIFLPVTTHSPMPGVLVFATRRAHAYHPEHLELLSNLATVITLSFGRTLRLAEHARLAAIGQFSSGIAHEIRTPLATVGMALDYFSGRPLAEPERKRLELARKELGRIERLLSEVLLYARPLKLRLERLTLCKLLEQVRETLSEEASRKGNGIRLRCGQDTELTGDADRLTQILLNLTRNALEAAPPGTPVTLEAESVEGGRLMEIRVHNRGEPIPREQREKIFEPFYTTRPRGTGLGLAIVRRLVEAHGGNVTVTSTSPEVTSFLVRLPVLD